MCISSMLITEPAIKVMLKSFCEIENSVDCQIIADDESKNKIYSSCLAISNNFDTPLFLSFLIFLPAVVYNIIHVKQF